MALLMVIVVFVVIPVVEGALLPRLIDGYSGDWLISLTGALFVLLMLQVAWDRVNSRGGRTRHW